MPADRATRAGEVHPFRAFPIQHVDRVGSAFGVWRDKGVPLPTMRTAHLVTEFEWDWRGVRHD